MTWPVKLLLYVAIAVVFSNEAAKASLVIIYRTQEASFIGADSRVSTPQGVEAGSVCKIHVANDDVVWSSTGVFQELRGPFDVVSIVDSAIAQRGSFEDVVSLATIKTEKQLRSFLVRLSGNNPAEYNLIVRNQYPLSIVFIRKNIIYASAFFLPNRDNPRNVQIIDYACPGRSCPEGEQRIVLGEHDQVDKALISPALRGLDTVGKINHLMQAQHLAMPNRVAPPVAILRIDSKGTLQWVQKGECK